MNILWTPQFHILGGCQSDGKSTVEGKPHGAEPRLQSGQTTVSFSEDYGRCKDENLGEGKISSPRLLGKVRETKSRWSGFTRSADETGELNMQARCGVYHEVQINPQAQSPHWISYM